jgi:hypothetical protein
MSDVTVGGANNQVESWRRDRLIGESKMFVDDAKDSEVLPTWTADE